MTCWPSSEAQSRTRRPAAESQPRLLKRRTRTRRRSKVLAMPMLQRGGVKIRDVWQSGAPFGDGFTFGTVTAIDKFADYDLAPRAERVLGADGARAYQEKLSHMIVSQRTMAVQDRVELSIAPAANAKV